MNKTDYKKEEKPPTWMEGFIVRRTEMPRPSNASLQVFSERVSQSPLDFPKVLVCIFEDAVSRGWIDKTKMILTESSWVTWFQRKTLLSEQNRYQSNKSHKRTWKKCHFQEIHESRSWCIRNLFICYQLVKTFICILLGIFIIIVFSVLFSCFQSSRKLQRIF